MVLLRQPLLLVPPLVQPLPLPLPLKHASYDILFVLVRLKHLLV